MVSSPNSNRTWIAFRFWISTPRHPKKFDQVDHQMLNSRALKFNMFFLAAKENKKSTSEMKIRSFVPIEKQHDFVQVLVISRVTTPTSRVKSPQLPIYFRPFTGGPFHPIYNVSIGLPGSRR